MKEFLTETDKTGTATTSVDIKVNKIFKFSLIFCKGEYFLILLHAKMAMPDLQRYPPLSDLNVEEPFVFRTRNFISASFSIASYNKECASHFRSETVFENKQFKETKTLT